jgi:DNA-binding NarL/FixJ family response regulator
MAQGWDNVRIADELNLAEQTVRNYVSRIYTALGVNSRAEALVWAGERGLG